eukprot:4918862-Prymnesium_polylepis.1
MDGGANALDRLATDVLLPAFTAQGLDASRSDTVTPHARMWPGRVASGRPGNGLPREWVAFGCPGNGLPRERGARLGRAETGSAHPPRACHTRACGGAVCPLASAACAACQRRLRRLPAP